MCVVQFATMGTLERFPHPQFHLKSQTNHRLFGCPMRHVTTRLLQFNRKGLNMSVLKTLNFIVAPKRTNDPVQQRRLKLIMQLEQQRSFADNPMFVSTTQRWRKGEDGSKRLVERQKRVKAWWRADAAGQCVLTVRYGAKLIEFEKGKAAIAVGDKTNLVSVIDAVIAAVNGGELDAAIAGTQKLGQKPRIKAG